MLIIKDKIKFNISNFKKAVLRDKKASKSNVGFILSKGCGKMFLRELKINQYLLNDIRKFNNQIKFGQTKLR
jgi:3-dehydroquinate synthetase